MPYEESHKWHIVLSDDTITDWWAHYLDHLDCSPVTSVIGFTRQVVLVWAKLYEIQNLVTIRSGPVFEWVMITCRRRSQYPCFYSPLSRPLLTHRAHTHQFFNNIFPAAKKRFPTSCRTRRRADKPNKWNIFRLAMSMLLRKCRNKLPLAFVIKNWGCPRVS